MNDLYREELAALCHNRWCRWVTYMLNQCQQNKDGTFTIPVETMKRWSRQVLTPYTQLPENEKESDRKESDMILNIMKLNGFDVN